MHAEYKFDSELGCYYASVGKLPKKNGNLSFLMLSSQYSQNAQIGWLRLSICLVDLAAVFLLFLFSGNFTKRLLIPLKNSREQQTHFIAAASHELRAPLAVIRTGLDALKKSDDVSEQAHFINLMDEESIRMQNLISGMLLLANSDSGRMPLQKTSCQPDEEKALIFSRFYRSDKARFDREHFGLGLSIAGEIVAAHGGKIWVEDNPDIGSCFAVRLVCHARES